MTKDYFNIFFDMGNIFPSLFSMMDAVREKKLREEKGITHINRYDGIEKLNIPHIYDKIEVRNNYFYCYKETITVYDSMGKQLFECDDVTYYEQGMFMVGRKKKMFITGKEDPDKFGYALYNEGTKLTEPIFRPTGLGSRKFNDFGFVVVGLSDKYNSAVINKSGKILLETKSLSYPSIDGVVCCDGDDKYINLLTGKVICRHGYHSLSTDEFMFIQPEINCVYQITKSTGEFVVHGKLKEEEPPKKATAVERVHSKPEPVIKQFRNDLCRCGSGKKYKHCCMNKISTA